MPLGSAQVSLGVYKDAAGGCELQRLWRQKLNSGHHGIHTGPPGAAAPGLSGVGGKLLGGEHNLHLQRQKP